MEDHRYSLAATSLGSDEDVIEEIETDEMFQKEKTINLDHTPIKGPNPKKKKKDKSADETMESILKALFELTGKMDRQTEKLDAQTDLLRKFETRIETNTAAIKTNKQVIEELQKKGG